MLSLTHKCYFISCFTCINQPQKNSYAAFTSYLASKVCNTWQIHILLILGHLQKYSENNPELKLYKNVMSSDCADFYVFQNLPLFILTKHFSQ